MKKGLSPKNWKKLAEEMWKGCAPRACKSALARLKIAEDPRLLSADDGAGMKDSTAGTNDTKDDKVTGARIDAEDGNDEMEMDEAERMAQDKGSDDGMMDSDEVVDRREREGEGQGEGDSEGEGGRASEGGSDGEIEGEGVAESKVDKATPQKRASSAKWGKGWVEVPSDIPVTTGVGSIMGRGHRQKKARTAGNESD